MYNIKKKINFIFLNYLNFVNFLILFFFITLFVSLEYKSYTEIKLFETSNIKKKLTFPHLSEDEKIEIYSDEKFNKVIIVFGGLADFNNHKNKILLPQSIEILDKKFHIKERDFFYKNFKYTLNEPTKSITVKLNGSTVIKKIFLFKESNKFTDFVQFNYNKLFYEGSSFFFIPIFLLLFLFSIDYFIYKIFNNKCSFYIQSLFYLPLRLIFFFFITFFSILILKNDFFSKLILLCFSIFGFCYCLKDNIFFKLFNNLVGKFFIWILILFIAIIFSKYTYLNLYIEYAARFPNNFESSFVGFFIDSFYPFGHSNFINDFLISKVTLKDYNRYILGSTVEWGFRIPNLFSFSLVPLLNFFQFKFLVYQTICFFIYISMFLYLFKLINLKEENIIIIFSLIILTLGAVSFGRFFEGIQYYYSIMLSLILIKNFNDKILSFCIIFLGIMTHPVFIVFLSVIVLFFLINDFFVAGLKKNSIYFLFLLILSIIFYLFFFKIISSDTKPHMYMNKFEILNFDTYLNFFSIFYYKILFYGNIFSGEFDFFSYTIILNLALYFLLTRINKKSLINFSFFFILLSVLIFVERNTALYTSASYNNVVPFTLSLLLLSSSINLSSFSKISKYYFLLFYLFLNFIYLFISRDNLFFLRSFDDSFKYINLLVLILLLISFIFLIYYILKKKNKFFL